MRRTFPIIVLLLCSTLVFGQGIQQKGVAYFYDFKTKTKTPLANVSLRVNGADPATSQADGTFVLSFGSQVKMGDKISQSSQPYYKGMKVFNKDEVENWYVVDGSLRLIMCDSEEFELVKKEWYDRGVASVEKQRAEEIASLQKGSDEYSRQLAGIQAKYDRILDDMRSNADAMARIDQSKLDASMKEVMDLYLNGSVDEAVQKIRNMRIAESWNVPVHTAEGDPQNILSELRLSADLFKHNGDYEKAGEILKLIADKLNTYEDAFAYAEFCAARRNYDEAIQYYEKALEILRRLSANQPGAYDADIAEALRDLAFYYALTQRYEESDAMYKESLAMYRKANDANPGEYNLRLAKVMYELATLYYDMQRYPESETLYREAFNIFKSLPYVGLDDALTESNVINNLASICVRTDRFEESVVVRKEGLALVQKQYETDPEIWRSPYSSLLTTRAYEEIILKNYSEAEVLVSKGMELGLATDYWTIGLKASALLFQGKYSEAESLYLKYKEYYGEFFLELLQQFADEDVIPKKRKADVEKIKALLSR